MSTQIQGKAKLIQNDNIEQHVKSSDQKTTITLETAKNPITMNGGILYPIGYKEVLAGETVEDYSIDNLTRIITPRVPTLDRIYMNIRAYFVPHTRVWETAEKVLAGKADLSLRNMAEEEKALPRVTITNEQTKPWGFKDTLMARYGVPNNSATTTYNVLLPRGYRAIYNDFIRNKDYELPKPEFNSTEVSLTEARYFAPYNTTAPYAPNYINEGYRVVKAPTRKNYLTNVKSQIGLDTAAAGTGTASLQNHLDWQTAFMDAKQRADNANKNDWDIIAELGGTQPVLADRVEFLGQVDYELNYQQITQSAPTIDNSGPLGTTGSFSYTKANGTLFNYKHFKQHGFIHILASITIDKQFEESTPKELLKQMGDEIYRPGLSKKEVQLLMKKEIGNINTSTDTSAGYQPAWAEYKRLPSITTGEMRSRPLKLSDETDTVSNSHWHNIPTMTSVNQSVIDGNYFNPLGQTVAVLQRNNLIYTSTIPTDVGEYEMTDPIMNISLHKVKTRLPIVSSTINSVSKAEQTR